MEMNEAFMNNQVLIDNSDGITLLGGLNAMGRKSSGSVSRKSVRISSEGSLASRSESRQGQQAVKSITNKISPIKRINSDGRVVRTQFGRRR